MTKHYGKTCRHCSGEDCICCEVYQEYRADLQAAREEEFESLHGDDDDSILTETRRSSNNRQRHRDRRH